MIGHSPLPPEVVHGDGVKLRLARDTDVEDIVAACNDRTMTRFLQRMPIPYTTADAEDFVSRHVPASWEAGSAPFVIADPETDRLLGTINVIRKYRTQAAIGYWVASWARRRGVATAATRAVAGWAFGNGMQRLELSTDLGNIGSQRVAIGAGFQHEGVRRAVDPGRDGVWRDLAYWSRIASDPGDPVPPAMPFTGPLTDGVVTLVPLAPEDDTDLYALAVLPDVLATTVAPAPPTLSSTHERCRVAGYQWILGRRAEFTIRDAATGAFAGDIGLYPEPVTRQAMTGYTVVPAWRGRGYATRAVRLVTTWAFDAAGVARVVAGTAPGNVGSQRVLEAAGFSREGYERDRLPGRSPGERVDNIAYALLPSDRARSAG